MKFSWKIKQFTNHRNNTKHKTLVYAGEKIIKFTQWKCDSIISTMKSIYKSEKNVDKTQVINGIYNLMKLSDKRMVVIINNDSSAQVMNENDIKKSIRMYFKSIYITNTSETINTLINNVHKSWCDHFTKVKPSTYDVLPTYDYQIL